LGGEERRKEKGRGIKGKLGIQPRGCSARGRGAGGAVKKSVLNVTRWGKKKPLLKEDCAQSLDAERW